MTITLWQVQLLPVIPDSLDSTVQDGLALNGFKLNNKQVL